MSQIPEDVMQRAKEATQSFLGMAPCYPEQFQLQDAFARAILSDRSRSIAETGESNHALQQLTRVDTGCKDKDGNPLYLGDRVRYGKEGPHTKQEYWNPEYEIIWDAPAFTLKHVGGGKDGGSHAFILKHGGLNGDLTLISRGHHSPSPKTLTRGSANE